MKEYTFSYRFDGKSWSFGIFAESPEEAKAKFRALAANAQYDGEVMTKIYVPVNSNKIKNFWKYIQSWFRGSK